MAENKHSLMVRGYIMTLCGGLCWAIGGACGQMMFRDCGVTSDWLVPIRLFIGGLITLGVAALTGGKPLEVLRHREAVPPLLVFALLGSALCQYSYYTAVQYANVAFATVLSYCSPIVILLWTILSTRKKPRFYESISVLLVVLGAFTCVTHFDFTTLAVPVKGAVWGLISAVCFAFYTVSPRKLMQKFSVLSITGWGMTIGGAVMLLMFRPWRMSGIQFGGKLYLLMACVIILGTVLSFSLFQSGCNIVGSLVGSVLSSVEPIGSVVISVLFLNTTFSWLDLLGFFLILVTIPIMAFGKLHQPGGNG